MGDGPAAGSATKRALWLIVVALLLAAAALWGSSELTWFAEHRDLPLGGTTLHTESGSDYSGALVPVAVLALAAIAGVVATGGWARRVLGAVVVLAGGGIAARGVVGIDLAGGGDYPTMSILAGRGLAVLAGVLLVLGGVFVVRLARRMPRLGERYAAPSKQRAARDPDTELWDRLSAGDDPTTDE